MDPHNPKRRHWKKVTGILLGAALVLAFPLLVTRGTPEVTQQEVRMRTSNTLVIYYSRTGTTAKVAEELAAKTGADVERLTDTVDRRGAFGYLRSLYDAGRRRGSTLNPLRVDPTAYPLVIIGTPEWGYSVSSPVRTFLTAYKGRLPQVAFFLTSGGKNQAPVFADMATLVGREPVAKLGLVQDDVLAGRHADALAGFVRSLPAVAPVRPKQPAPRAEAQF